MLNPYIAGAPVVEPSMFFGRQDVFEWIERSLTGKYVNHILVIHGQRRVGKTSVLKQIPNFLPKDYIQVFFDLQGRTDTMLDRFLWWVAREIARVLKQEHNLAIPTPDLAAFTGDTETLIANFLPEIRSLLGDRRLLLTFDEFDTLEQHTVRETLAKPLIDYLRRLFDLEGLNLIFSIGSSGHKLENMQAAYTDFFKTALYRKISFLEKEDCTRLITQPVKDLVEYEDKAVEGIFAVTAGHPYFTQLVCHELFSQCQKTDRWLITRDDVRAILDDVIERGTVNLKFTWDEAASLEKWMLACLAQSEKAHTNQELADLVRRQKVRFSESDFNSALIHLRDKDVLSNDNRFVVYLLHRWLQKNRPLERVREELAEINPIADRYIEIGEEYRGIGQTGKALESFLQALTVDARNFKAQLAIAAIYQEQQDYENAAAAFDKALGLDEEDVNARAGFCDSNLALGDQAKTKGDLNRARECYLRALEINPEHNGARQRMAGLFSGMAEVELASGNGEKALMGFKEALHYTPEDETLRKRYAEVQAQQLDLALAKLTQSSRQAASTGDWIGAIESITEALRLAPERTDLVETLEGLKKAHIEAQLSQLRERTRAATAAERWEEAEITLQEYLAMNPADAVEAQETLNQVQLQKSLNLFYGEAQAAMAAHEYQKAVTLLKRVILQDETYKEAARLLAVAIEGQRKEKGKTRTVFLSGKLWYGAAGVLVLLVLVFFGVQFGPAWVNQLGIFNPPAVDLSEVETTPALIPTRKSEPTPLPTVTASGQPEQEFNQSVFKILSETAPTFEDDFSSIKPEWSDAPVSISFKDQSLILHSAPGQSGAITQEKAIAGKDFVLSFDFKCNPQSDTTSPINLKVVFRQSRDSWNAFTLNMNPQGDPHWAVYDTQKELAEGEISLSLDGWNNLTVAAENGMAAFYINNQNLATTLIQPYFSPYLTINLDANMEVDLAIDNLKFWRLGAQNQWIAEVAEPLFTKAAGKSPTYQNDFSTPSEDFKLEGTYKYEDSSLVLDSTGGFASGFDSPSPIDGETFVLQFDLTPWYPKGPTMGASLDFSLKSGTSRASLYIGLDDPTSNQGSNHWALYEDDRLIDQGDYYGLVPNATNQFLFVVQQDQIGFYLNGAYQTHINGVLPFALFNNFHVFAKEKGEIAVAIDNLKFWRFDQ